MRKLRCPLCNWETTRPHPEHVAMDYYCQHCARDMHLTNTDMASKDLLRSLNILMRDVDEDVAAQVADAWVRRIEDRYKGSTANGRE